MARIDLHIHSRFSDRSAEWILRQFRFPDSYTQPAVIYDRLRQNGMDFVTITDHNTIDGCLEIAGRPGAFISEEVSAYFPEDRCRVHLLVWDITEEHHDRIQGLRENIYDLQKYLAGEGVTHAVSHPLYRVDDRFTASHLERLFLLFKNFEGINGLRDSLLGDIFRFIASGLTPERIAEFADRHGIRPTHPEPWKKILTAGSDDHGGIFAGSAFTEAESCASPRDFLSQVDLGRCSIHGKGGTSLAFSHSLYNTIYSFLDERVLKGKNPSSGLLAKVFSRFMEGRNPTEFSLAEKIGFVAQGVLSGQVFELVKPAHASLWKQFSDYFAETDIKSLLARQTAGVAEPERRAFLIANLFANQLAFRLFTHFVKELSSGNLIQSIQDFSTLVPVLLTLSPYVYSFHSQAPSRRWLREICRTTVGEIPAVLRNRKRAWFTDTLEDVNGVATTIQKMTAAGVAAGEDLVVVTSRTSIQITGIPIKNFQPIGEFELPEYELQKLSFPPILEMLDYIKQEQFTELIIGTPGPVGLTALLAAKTFGLRASGIYHTDFPQYIRILTDDSYLETLTWNYMHWFYSQLDHMFVNSDEYRRRWADRGIDPAKISIFPRGLDLTLFDPKRRDPDFWQRRGVAKDALVLLYVGRVSKEKNLDVLACAYRKLRADGLPVALALVGDGPYLKELKESSIPDACFTGYLQGAELAQAFASADIFLFPSTTDTFGNVILEALASGLPCVVSDQGGPKELVIPGKTGLITRSLDAGDFTSAVRSLVSDEALRRAMGANARDTVRKRDWAVAFEKFWSASPD